MSKNPKKVNAKDFDANEDLVINAGKIFFQGICINEMGRLQKIGLIGSLLSMYSILKEDVQLVVSVFSEDVYNPFKDIKRNGFYALDGCDENEYSTDVKSRIRLDEVVVDKKILSEIMVEDQYGETHNAESAPDDAIDYTLSNLMRNFFIYRRVMEKISSSMESMREIESNMVMYAISEKLIDSSYENIVGDVSEDEDGAEKKVEIDIEKIN